MRLTYAFLVTNILFINSAKSLFNLAQNDNCESDFTGENGVCLEAKDCEAFKTNRNELKICSFNDRVPVVCCPQKQVHIDNKLQVNITRISAIKCSEYLKLPKASNIRYIRSPQFGKIGKFKLDGQVKPTFVGGQKSSLNEFPHMSAIGWREGNGIDWKCGGTLISEKFVLSASHCTSSGGKKPQVIRVGGRDLANNDNSNYQQFGIKNIIVHPDYSGILKYNDIALFELDRNAILSGSFLPACLSQTKTDPDSAEAMGYGHTSFAGIKSNYLMKGYLKIVNNSQCNLAYEDDTSQLPQGITEMQICAIDPAGNKDTCQGDSGGPLQITKYHEGNVYYEIIGVTSFGKFCAAGAPGVYVRVYSYLDWIERIVWAK